MADGSTRAGDPVSGRDGSANPVHGPGVTWLAEQAGCTPAELLGEPGRLCSALGLAGTALVDLAAGLESADADRRVEAERSAEALRAHFADAPAPGDRFRASVTQALNDAAERLRQEQRPG